MSETFSVGEIAIYVRPGSRHYGCEVTIVGPLAVRSSRDIGSSTYTTGPSYVIESVAMGPAPWSEWICHAPWLRKKRPPQDWVKLCHLTDLPREVTHV